MTTQTDYPALKPELFLSRGTTNGIEWVIARGPEGTFHINGYVRIPEGNPWRGIGIDRIHGTGAPFGLSFEDDNGWIGFDTENISAYWPGQDRASKFHDYKEWTLEDVVEATKSLARKVAAAPEGDRLPVYPDPVQAAKDAAHEAWENGNVFSDEAFDKVWDGYRAGLADR